MMGKAILILDEMPKDCSECVLRGEDAERKEPCCFAVPGGRANKQYNGLKRPGWCPLRLLPEQRTAAHKPRKNTEISAILLVTKYVDGWNDCLDAIAGGQE